jgi:hypothetical protein
VSLHKSRLHRLDLVRLHADAPSLNQGEGTRREGFRLGTGSGGYPRVGGAREGDERSETAGTTSGCSVGRQPAIGRTATTTGGAVGAEVLVP